MADEVPEFPDLGSVAPASPFPTDSARESFVPGKPIPPLTASPELRGSLSRRTRRPIFSPTKRQSVSAPQGPLDAFLSGKPTGAATTGFVQDPAPSTGLGSAASSRPDRVFGPASEQARLPRGESERVRFGGGADDGDNGNRDNGNGEDGDGSDGGENKRACPAAEFLVASECVDALQNAVGRGLAETECAQDEAGVPWLASALARQYQCAAVSAQIFTQSLAVVQDSINKIHSAQLQISERQDRWLVGAIYRAGLLSEQSPVYRNYRRTYYRSYPHLTRAVQRIMSCAAEDGAACGQTAEQWNSVAGDLEKFLRFLVKNRVPFLLNEAQSEQEHAEIKEVGGHYALLLEEVERTNRFLSFDRQDTVERLLAYRPAFTEHLEKCARQLDSLAEVSRRALVASGSRVSLQ